MDKLSEAEEMRFNSWIEGSVSLLAKRHGLSLYQAIKILEDINNFQKVFDAVETDKFINVYLYGVAQAKIIEQDEKGGNEQ